ncbi:MAG: histidinol-phosphatase HisJ family protein [Chloroflexota bacterium]|nr:MAG: histidinol-phosphatase HisJ family protein [Chloroflexota bacterium]
MISVDYHTHHWRCGHAQGQIEDYIKQALALGMSQIGISDHAPIYWQDGDDPMPKIAMAKSELPAYVDEVLRLKQKYADRIAVRLGLEVDYIEGAESLCAELLAPYPFDYLIGSVHYVYGRNVYDTAMWQGVSDPLPTYAEYYRLLSKSAQCGLFDIIAHSTAIVALAPKPIPSAIEPLQEAALGAIRQADVCVEINTSGYRKLGTEPFPTARMIGRARDLGIPLTFGSDAHHPSDVGYARERIQDLLNMLGVIELACFEGRQRGRIALMPRVFHA